MTKSARLLAMTTIYCDYCLADRNYKMPLITKQKKSTDINIWRKCVRKLMKYDTQKKKTGRG